MVTRLEVVIRKSQQEKKVITRENKIVKLENEIVVFEIVFENVQGQLYKRSCGTTIELIFKKLPIYQFLIIRIKNHN